MRTHNGDTETPRRQFFIKFSSIATERKMTDMPATNIPIPSRPSLRISPCLRASVVDLFWVCNYQIGRLYTCQIL
jgi:hypothetical protein